METWLQTIVTIVCTVAASGGFWTWLQTRANKNSSERQMILGLGHDRLMKLCTEYLDRKQPLTKEEYENLHKYLYLPYKALKGNGTVDRMMKEIENIPVSGSALYHKEDDTD